ncbi:MAG TPA: patatin-like phospholipase family protein [Streptosporangiaceae bacterium]|nr:patatin-like phospholipase family protein [Streptosporangiaceae bacterium]
MPDGDALVLGGGGVAGISWITGLLAGLADAGQDVTGADVLIGTSAGANVAAQLGSGLPLAELLARQTDPARQASEIPADIEIMSAEMEQFMADITAPEEARRRMGAWALAARTVPEAARRRVIESRLPAHDWPRRRLLLTAVDARTGEPRFFANDSGVSLVDAVAASCAVPGIWPPVTIGAHRYIDGGFRSLDNADLAAGSARVTIVSPMGFDPPFPVPMPLRAAVDELLAGGSEVTVLVPDESSRAAIGANPLDPATREPAARAGREQGLAGLPPAARYQVS